MCKEVFTYNLFNFVLLFLPHLFPYSILNIKLMSKELDMCVFNHIRSKTRHAPIFYGSRFPIFESVYFMFASISKMIK